MNVISSPRMENSFGPSACVEEPRGLADLRLEEEININTKIKNEKKKKKGRDWRYYGGEQ